MIITKEYYLQNRTNMSHKFIYDVYLDTNPEKTLSMDHFMYVIQNYMWKRFSNLNDLAKSIVEFYDNYFEIKILSKGDKIIKIW